MTITTMFIEEHIPSDQEDAVYPLDHPFRDLTQWGGWAWYRTRPTWIEPEPVHSLDKLRSLTTHFLLIRNNRETSRPKVVCIYPVSTDAATSHLTSKLELGAIRRLGREEPRALVRQCVLAARAWLSKIDADKLPAFTSPTIGGPFDRIGFCTWSSLGENVHPTRATVDALLESLVEHKLPVQSFILDDGWQDQRTFLSGTCAPDASETGLDEDKGVWRQRGLRTFEASKAVGDLAELVRVTKSKLKSVDGVGQVEFGVWMALNGGYWNGVDPDSTLIQEYHCRPYNVSRGLIPHIPNKPVGAPNEAIFWLPSPSEAHRFWHDWFAHLKSLGVDFVKVDNQARLRLVPGIAGGEIHDAMWNGMVRAADDVFGHGRVIHCMAHDETMFAGPNGLGLASCGERFIFRNSDDFGFIHDNPDSHQKHILVNLFNAILTSHLCMVPDADMFMTAAQNPLAHALARAFFPGPLLLADKPREHDKALLQRLIGRDKTGVWRVFKTHTAVRPLPRRILDLQIIGTGRGRGLWGAVRTGEGASLGVWNVRDEMDASVVEDSLTYEDLQDAVGETEGEWAVYQAGLASRVRAGFVSLGAKGAIAPVILERMGCEAFYLAPTHPLGQFKVACIGVTSLFAALAAVNNIVVTSDSITMRVACEGTLTVLFDRDPSSLKITVDDGEVEYSVSTCGDWSSSTVYMVQIPVAPLGAGNVQWAVKITVF